MLEFRKAIYIFVLVLIAACSSFVSRSPSGSLTCDEAMRALLVTPSRFAWMQKGIQRLSYLEKGLRIKALIWMSEHIVEDSPFLFRSIEAILNELKLSPKEFEEVASYLPKSSRFKLTYLSPKVKLLDAESVNQFKKEIVVDQLVSKLQLDELKRDEFLHLADESVLNLNQWNKIHQTLRGVEKETLEREQRFQKFIMFLSTLPPRSRQESVQNVLEFFNPQTEFKQAQIFQKQLNKFSEHKMVLERKFKNLPTAQRTFEVEKALKTYEKLSLSCRSRGSTMEKQFAAKQGTKFFLGLGLASTTGSYFYNNWDKDHDMKWFGNLGFDITTSFIFTFAYTKILGSNQSGFIGTSLKAYATFAGLDYLSAEAYSQIFGVSQAEAEERLQTMLKNPKAREELARLKDMLESEKFDEKLSKNIEKIVQNMDAQNLDEIINDESNRERILEAISFDMYAQEAGEMIRTGDKGLDRYLFHRGYDVIGTPKGIAIGYLIFSTLCRNSANPKVALAKALFIYLADRVTFDYIYYNLRRQAINF
ncbi:MAG: hypothetical protein OHK0056_09900 [Bacteriovoracaceae bacterium]